MVEFTSGDSDLNFLKYLMVLATGGPEGTVFGGTGRGMAEKSVWKSRLEQRGRKKRGRGYSCWWRQPQARVYPCSRQPRIGKRIRNSRRKRQCVSGWCEVDIVVGRDWRAGWLTYLRRGRNVGSGCGGIRNTALAFWGPGRARSSTW